MTVRVVITTMFIEKLKSMWVDLITLYSLHGMLQSF